MLPENARRSTLGSSEGEVVCLHQRAGALGGVAVLGFGEGGTGTGAQARAIPPHEPGHSTDVALRRCAEPQHRADPGVDVWQE